MPVKRPVPRITLLILAAAVAVQLSPPVRALAIYDRGSVLAGEGWRLFTGHWVHFSASHLLLDCLALGLAGAFVELRARRLWLFFLAVVPWWIGGGLLALDPALAVYGGLSGLALGAVLLASLILWREGGWARWLAVGFAALTFTKLVGEAGAGGALFAALPAGVVVSRWSHLLGAAGALVVLGGVRCLEFVAANPRLLSGLPGPSVTVGCGGVENRSGVRAGEESPNTTGRDAA